MYNCLAENSLTVLEGCGLLKIALSFSLFYAESCPSRVYNSIKTLKERSLFQNKQHIVHNLRIVLT